MANREEHLRQEKDRVIVALDPWRHSPTGDEDWTLTYDFPEGDDLWEIEPAA